MFPFQLETLLSSSRKYRSGKEKFDLINKNLVMDLIDFLEPFEVHTKKLESRNVPTLQYAALAQDDLLEHCHPRAENEESQVMASIRSSARELISEKFVIREEHKVRWPPFYGPVSKTLIFAYLAKSKR